MGAEIVYCSLCGTRILEKDLISGRAFTLLDKTFCADCKSQAFAQMDGGEEPAAPAAKPVAARAAARPAAPAPAAQARRPAARPAPAPAPEPEEEPQEEYAEEPAARPVRRKKNPLPYVLAGSVGFLALVVALVLMLKTENQTRTEQRKESVKKTEERRKAAESPDERASKKMDELDAFVKANSADPAAVLAKLRAAESDVAGTASDDQYRALVKRWKAKGEELEASKQLEEQLGRIRKLVAEDNGTYSRWDQVKAELQKARELAVQKCPDRKPDVEELERQYVEPLEDKARTWSRENSSYLTQLEQEGNFKAVVQIIDRFPQELRRSDIWKQLKRQRDDADKKVQAKAAGTDPRDWKYWVRVGDQDLGVRNYTRARENYLKGLGMAPAASGLNADERKKVAITLFNIACIHGIDAKTKEGADRAADLDKCFEYLEKSGAAGLFSTSCGCHAKWTEHWEKDEDLEAARPDARYKKLLEKYAK